MWGAGSRPVRAASENRPCKTGWVGGRDRNSKPLGGEGQQSWTKAPSADGAAVRQATPGHGRQMDGSQKAGRSERKMTSAPGAAASHGPHGRAEIGRRQTVNDTKRDSWAHNLDRVPRARWGAAGGRAAARRRGGRGGQPQPRDRGKEEGGANSSRVEGARAAFGERRGIESAARADAAAVEAAAGDESQRRAAAKGGGERAKGRERGAGRPGWPSTREKPGSAMGRSEAEAESAKRGEERIGVARAGLSWGSREGGRGKPPPGEGATGKARWNRQGSATRGEIAEKAEGALAAPVNAAARVGEDNAMGDAPGKQTQGISGKAQIPAKQKWARARPWEGAH